MDATRTASGGEGIAPGARMLSRGDLLFAKAVVETELLTWEEINRCISEIAGEALAHRKRHDDDRGAGNPLLGSGSGDRGGVPVAAQQVGQIPSPQEVSAARPSSLSLSHALLERDLLSLAQVTLTEEIIGRRIFFCPGCSRKYNIFGKLPGRRFRCKSCSRVITIPDPTGSVSPANDEQPAQAPAGARTPDAGPPSVAAAGEDDATVLGDSSAHVPVLDEDAPSRVPFRDLGKFQILEEISRGGMGVVFKAKNRDLARVEAVKILLAQEDASGEEIGRFGKECEALARIKHPGVITLYEVGAVEGKYFYSMEYVEGRTLADRVDTGGPMAPRLAVEIVRDIADALEAIHEQGIIHRDLKPSNILIDPGGKARIIDFGIAKDLRTRHGLTESDSFLGTPHYMSPEQASGRDGDVGTRSDVYSLGGVLYFLLSGKPPYEGESPLKVVYKVVNRDVFPASLRSLGIDPTLEAICCRALAKDPASRYESAAALRQELADYLDGREVLARPSTPVERVIGVARRNSKWLAAVVALVTVLVASRFYQRRIVVAHRQATVGLARQLEVRIGEQLRRDRPLVAVTSFVSIRKVLGRVPGFLAPLHIEARRRLLVARGRLRTRRGAAAGATDLAAAAYLGVRLELDLGTNVDPPSVAGGPAIWQDAINTGLHQHAGLWWSRAELLTQGLFLHEGVWIDAHQLAARGLVPHGWLAYARDRILRMGLTVHRGRAWLPTELRSRGLIPHEGTWLSASELASRGLIVHEGRAWTLTQMLAQGYHLHEGKWLVRSRLVAMGLFEHQGQWSTASQLREMGLYGHEGRGYTRNDLSAAGLVPYKGEVRSSERLLEVAARWKTRPRRVRDLVWSSNRTLISVSGGKGISLWSRAGKDLGVLTGHRDEVLGLAWNDGRKTLVSCGKDGTVRFWSAVGERWKFLNMRVMPGHPFVKVAVGPDDRVYAASARGNIFVYNLFGSQFPRILRQVTGVSSMGLDRNGSFLLVTAERRLIVWELQTFRRRVYPGRFDIVQASPTRSCFGLSRGSTLYYNCTGGGPVSRAHGSPVSAMVFTPDGSLVVTGDRDGTVMVHDAESLKLLHVRPACHRGAVTALSVAPDGLRVASGGDDGWVLVHRFHGSRS